jgi:hypothetical protein
MWPVQCITFFCLSCLCNHVRWAAVALLQSALDARRAANLGDRGSGSSMIFVNALVVAITALILAVLTTLRQFTTVTGRFQGERDR